jgi:dipeptide/tripeptide permease
VHGTAFATLTLVNNLLGLAPGPYLTGVLADRLGLDVAFRLVPLVSLAAAAVFWSMLRHYSGDVQRAAQAAAARAAAAAAGQGAAGQSAAGAGCATAPGVATAPDAAGRAV